VIRRLLLVVPTLLSVYTVTFLLIHATPGGPWDASELPLTPQAIENLNAKYHLDDPLWKQYVDYLGGALRGDLGPSYSSTSRDVADIVGDSFPVSVQIGLLALAVGIAVGIPLGVLAALRRNSWLDYTAMFVAVSGIATPSYVITTLLVFSLAVQLHAVPVFGWGGVADVRILVPVLALSFRPAATFARYSRSAMLEVVAQDYVRTARAKGLSHTRIVVRHMLKNAMTPVVTVGGISLANIVTGSFFVETIYNVPGIGRFFVNAALGRDYPVLMAVTLLYAGVIVIANLIVDLAYALLDPRVRYR